MGTLISTLDIFNLYLEFKEAKFFYLFASISLGLIILHIFKKSNNKLILIFLKLILGFSLVFLAIYGYLTYYQLIETGYNPLEFFYYCILYIPLTLISFAFINSFFGWIGKKLEPNERYVSINNKVSRLISIIKNK